MWASCRWPELVQPVGCHRWTGFGWRTEVVAVNFVVNGSRRIRFGTVSGYRLSISGYRYWFSVQNVTQNIFVSFNTHKKKKNRREEGEEKPKNIFWSIFAIKLTFCSCWFLAIVAITIYSLFCLFFTVYSNTLNGRVVLSLVFTKRNELTLFLWIMRNIQKPRKKRWNRTGQNHKKQV